MSTCREKSKQDWFCDKDPGLIKLGCLQRIADATELMAINHQELVAERDRYQDLAKRNYEEMKRLERSNQALRGVITRMKIKGGDE